MHLLAGLGVAAVLLAGQPATPQAPAQVTVHMGQTLATIAPGAAGVNTPLWNPRLLDRPVPGLIREAGIGMLEFNGGGVMDLYHWRDGSFSPDPEPDAHLPIVYEDLKPQFSFDQFEQIARSAGARTTVHVNYGTGTPQEAAAWVRYANKVKHYGVRDWVIGEEVWGNGWIEGLNFEPDAHQDKSPTAYATNALEFIAAMKAVDPTIRVGVEVTGINAGPFREWDETVARIAGHAVDFVDFHRYPFFEEDTSDAALLKLPRQIPADIAATRELVGPDVDLVVGETNSSNVNGLQQISQFNALYLVDNNLTLLESGVRSVDWWALHNGSWGDTPGDLGLLSTSEPANTPFPPYQGMKVFGAVARPGGQLLSVSSTDESVVAHAIREPGGRTAVVLLNEDPESSHRVSVNRGKVRTLRPYSLNVIWI